MSDQSLPDFDQGEDHLGERAPGPKKPRRRPAKKAAKRAAPALKPAKRVPKKRRARKMAKPLVVSGGGLNFTQIIAMHAQIEYLLSTLTSNERIAMLDALKTSSK